jgi:WD40 repeat protein
MIAGQRQRELFSLGQHTAFVRVVALEAATGQPLGSPWQPVKNNGYAAVSPDGKTFVSLGLHACVGDAGSGEVLALLPVEGTGPGGIVFRPDSKAALVWDNDKGKVKACLVEMLEPKQFRIFELENGQDFAAAEFTRDSKFLFTARWRNNLHLQKRDATSGALLHEWPAGSFWSARGMALSPNGNTLLTGESLMGPRNVVTLRSTLTGKPVFELPQDDKVNAVAFSPDGTAFLTGGDDMTARLYDSRTGKQLRPAFQHDEKVGPVAFLDDQTILTRTTSAHLWDVATGKPLGPALPGTGLLVASPDGRSLLTQATARGDNAAVVWQLPAALPGSPKQVKLWVEVITGLELDATDTVQVLDAKAWQQRRDSLQQLGGPP